MDVEIHTTIGSWVTVVDEREVGNHASGAAAAYVQRALLAGRPIDARSLPLDGSPPDKAAPTLSMIFNPAHLVCVSETARRRQRLSEATRAAAS